MADSTFELLIKTTEDLKGFKAVEQQLKGQIVQAKALGKDYSETQKRLGQVQAQIAAYKPGFVDGLKANINDVVSTIPGMERLGGVLGKIATGPLGIIAVGITAIGAAIKGATKAIEEFAQSEARVASLDATLARIGELTDDNRAHFQKLASELQEVTGIADDRWLGVLQKLLQFGSNPKTIGIDIDAVKNLAGIVGDLETATQMYSKALQGNFTLFGRYGIIIDDAGTKTERLKKLQEELALRGTGQLEASSRTLLGTFGRLKNAVSDLFEAFGRHIDQTTFLRAGLNALVVATGFWADKIGGLVPKVDGLSNSVKKTTEKIDEAALATAKYETIQKDLAIQAAATAAAFDRQTNALKEQQKARDEIADAELALELEKIKQSEAAGDLTPLQALEKSLAIRKKFDDEKFQRAQATLDVEIRSKKIQEQNATESGKELESEKEKLSVMIAQVKAAEMRKAVHDQIKREIESAETLPDGPLKDARMQALGQQRATAMTAMLDSNRALPAEAGTVQELTAKLQAAEKAIAAEKERSATEKENLRAQIASLELRKQTDLTVRGLTTKKDAIAGGTQMSEATAKQAKASAEDIAAASAISMGAEARTKASGIDPIRATAMELINNNIEETTSTLKLVVSGLSGAHMSIIQVKAELDREIANIRNTMSNMNGR